MNKWIGTILAAAMFVVVATVVVISLSSCDTYHSYAPAPTAPGGRLYRAEAAPAPKAHGGTDNVNDAAFDAMFFKNYGVNPFVDTDDDHLSTFAIDVDTGSYTLARSYLDRGKLPEKDGVRVEEFINYFDYHYAPPGEGDGAVAIHTEVAPSKFGPGKLLMRTALKAHEIEAKDRKDAVLTFVIDISGSMGREDRLELVKKTLRLLVGQLREGDKIGIAVYGSSGRKVLSHRGIKERRGILSAIDGLRTGGATNAEEGLAIGYRMASEAFREGAINRVILCSDGVANVGRTGPKSIMKVIEANVKKGITLTAVGFGMGNYNDTLMEQLGDKGDGQYAYVDTLDEAKRVFVTNLVGTLQVVARDVKVQVEFNPKVVRSYRLLGYENRDVADKDFRNDKVDGGEIGAGHSVTALYELKLWPEKAGRLATVRVRHKDAEGGEVREIARDVASADARAAFDKASPAFRLAACVAEFAEVLRGSYWARGGSLESVHALAEQCRKDFDSRKDIRELSSLIERAKGLKGDERVQVGSGDEDRAVGAGGVAAVKSR